MVRRYPTSARRTQDTTATTATNPNHPAPLETSRPTATAAADTTISHDPRRFRTREWAAGRISDPSVSCADTSTPDGPADRQLVRRRVASDGSPSTCRNSGQSTSAWSADTVDGIAWAGTGREMRNP